MPRLRVRSPSYLYSKNGALRQMLLRAAPEPEDEEIVA
ncbi:hypothetical protein A2U01_0083985, partial [Trifolium medium]|nr:hypothetical protein [Trifolium medium]